MSNTAPHFKTKCEKLNLWRIKYKTSKHKYILNFPKNVFNLKKLTEHTTIATSKKMKVELKQVATKTTKGND